MHQFAGCGISRQTDKTHSYFIYLININVSRRYFDIIIDKNIVILAVQLFVQYYYFRLIIKLYGLLTFVLLLCSRSDVRR